MGIGMKVLLQMEPFRQRIFPLSMVHSEMFQAANMDGSWQIEMNSIVPERARRLSVQREPEPRRAPHDLDGAEGAAAESRWLLGPRRVLGGHGGLWKNLKFHRARR